MQIGDVVTARDVDYIQEIEKLVAYVRGVLAKPWHGATAIERPALDMRIVAIDEVTSGTLTQGPATKALAALCSTINNTGGVELVDDEVRPQADPEWIDLGDAYILACAALDLQPTVLDRRKVRKWMEHSADEHETATELAEAAAQAFDLYAGDGSTIHEWVFELALNYKG